eukprot:SAG31_NODE_30827_length_374_cov_1.286232_1_plen_64_part_00
MTDLDTAQSPAKEDSDMVMDDGKKAAAHFACCSLHDVLWHGVVGLLEEMSLPPVVRKLELTVG